VSGRFTGKGSSDERTKTFHYNNTRDATGEGGVDSMKELYEEWGMIEIMGERRFGTNSVRARE
jgi:hypothetical protein